jgi:hypothetical protein
VVQILYDDGEAEALCMSKERWEVEKAMSCSQVKAFLSAQTELSFLPLKLGLVLVCSKVPCSFPLLGSGDLIWLP